MYRQMLIIRIMEYPQPGRMVPNQKGGQNLADQNNFLYRKARNPSVFVILHHIMRERDGFIEKIQHHNRGKLDDNLRRKLDLQKLCEKLPTMERRIFLPAAMGHIN